MNGMNDRKVIYLDDAIDAVLELDADHRVSWRDAVIDTIDELPPAQPSDEYSKGWHDGRKALREEIWEDGRDRLD